MKHFVKLSGLLLFFCLMFFAAQAQQKHFIYVQSEDRQPFAIVMNGKVYSSSDYGYIIIPKLDDGEYKFTVSFPLNKFPDQSFAYTVNKKDAGFFLKNSTNGWALENMQTQKTVMSATAKASTSNNAFGDMLSDVVDDSTLTKNTTATKADAPPPAETPAGSSANIINNAPAVPVASGVVVTGAVASGGNEVTDETSSSAIPPRKLEEIKADTGTNMLFVDRSGNSSDTINVFIPVEPVSTEQAAVANTETTTITQDSLAAASLQAPNPAAVNATTATAPVFLDNDTTAEQPKEKSATDNPFYKPEENKAPAVVATAPVETGAAVNNVSNDNSVAPTNRTATSSAVKQDCDDMLSDDDFNKLRRKMFSQKGDDAMVQYAVKYVSKKCITTEQVKVLGNLFLSDDGRYNLYDALYKYVYDYGNYAGLESQILDPYYKKRFAALLR